MNSVFLSGRGAALLGAALALLLQLACNSSNPVVPDEPVPSTPVTSEGLSITVTASPAQLEAGAESPATVTVNVVRNADGQPPADGTTVAVNTDLGNFGTDNQGNATTLVSLGLRGGVATTAFFPGEELGTANLLAQVGENVGQLRLPIIESTEAVFFLLEVQPAVGSPEGGDLVTIQGEGFVAPLRVSFGSALARVVEVPSSRTILVETPPSVTPVNPGGSLLVDVAVTNSLDVLEPPTATLPGAFTYAFEAPPPFFVLEVEPDTGSAAGGETVSLRGGGFRGAVRVEFGGKNGMSATRVSSELITVVTPSAPSTVPDGGTLPVHVTVFHALDEEVPAQATLSGGYTYLGGSGPEVPDEVVVESISVDSGDYQGGTSVTVTGQGFVAPASVQLAGIQQNTVNVAGSTSLTFVTAGITVDSCPASGRIPQTGLTVTNLGIRTSGTAPGLTFNYLVTRPRVDSLSQRTGRQVGGETLTVFGGGFESPVRVLLVGSSESFAATVSSDSESSISVITPRLPDTFFPQESCLTGGGQPGARRLAATAGIEVVNLGSSCSDTLPNAFTITPANAGCIATGPGEPRTQCNDGLDNDADGLIDFSPFSPGDGGDPECLTIDDNDESQ